MLTPSLLLLVQFTNYVILSTFSSRRTSIILRGGKQDWTSRETISLEMDSRVDPFASTWVADSTVPYSSWLHHKNLTIDFLFSNTDHNHD